MEILTKVAMQQKGSNMKFNNLKLLLWTDESSLGVVLTLVSFFPLQARQKDSSSSNTMCGWCVQLALGVNCCVIW